MYYIKCPSSPSSPAQPGQHPAGSKSQPECTRGYFLLTSSDAAHLRVFSGVIMDGAVPGWAWLGRGTGSSEATRGLPAKELRNSTQERLFGCHNYAWVYGNLRNVRNFRRQFVQQITDVALEILGVSYSGVVPGSRLAIPTD